jgi:hypothetical protein
VLLLLLLFWLVVLVVDARVSYDNYRKMLVATADAKTLIITNPGQLFIHTASLNG